MRLHVILLEYLAPLSDIEAHASAHRDWLDEHYRSGLFITSGPQMPRTGGVILAMGESPEGLQSVIETDPFYVEGLADYKIIAFKPVKRGKMLDLPDILLVE